MFQGFSEETIQFLWGVTLNNERSWFQAHKQEYLTHHAVGALVFRLDGHAHRSSDQPNP